MNTNLQRWNLAVLLISLAVGGAHFSSFAQGTAFTYQGRLNNGAGPANGAFDLTFTLFDAPTGNGAFSVQTNSATGVTNGLFTVMLDFGAAVFSGPDRWLEIEVRTNGSGPYSPLLPRQKLTPTPYAITAENVASGGLAGAYTNALNLNNPANAFSGNGGGLTNVSALTLGGVGANGFWRNTGNAGTTAGPNFVGTTDNQPLEIQVNGSRAMRLEPHGAAAPSLAGGYYQNSVAGFYGAAIAGGGTSAAANVASGNYAFVGAGYGGNAGGNSAVVSGAYNSSPVYSGFIGSGQSNTNLSDYSFIGTGSNNLIQANSPGSFIGGGEVNVIGNNSVQATLAGGLQNSIGTNAGEAAIGGGALNVIQDNSGSSTIAGGWGNLVQGGGTYDTIGGGFSNSASGSSATVGGGAYNTASGSPSTVSGGRYNNVSGDSGTVGGGYRNSASGNSSTIGGGQNNSVSSDSTTVGGGYGNAASGDSATVGGGYFNVADGLLATVGGGASNYATNDYATVPGGLFNVAGGPFSFAAGQQAQALHLGSFVWADSQGTAFASTANDQFNVRAQGGARFVTGGAGLAVDGQVAASSFTGNGSALSFLTAGSISSGTLADARLTANAALLNRPIQTFTGGTNSFTGSLGIGTSSPQALFNVNGTARIDAVTAPYSEGLTLNLPTDMSGGGYGGMTLHNAARGGTYGSSTIKWGVYYNYTPEAGVGGKGLAFFQNNVSTRLYISTNGYVGIGNNNPGHLLVVGNQATPAYCDGLTWQNASDRNVKEGFTEIDSSELLEKVSALPITRWKYKAEAAGAEHLGPMAQDFHAAFGLNGTDDKHISTLDEAGVALAAIQGLNQKIDDKDAEIQRLKQRLERLEKLVIKQAEN